MQKIIRRTMMALVPLALAALSAVALQAVPINPVPPATPAAVAASPSLDGPGEAVSCAAGDAGSLQSTELPEPGPDAQCPRCSSDAQCINHCCASGVGICAFNGNCLCQL